MKHINFTQCIYLLRLHDKTWLCRMRFNWFFYLIWKPFSPKSQNHKNIVIIICWVLLTSVLTRWLKNSLILPAIYSSYSKLSLWSKMSLASLHHILLPVHHSKTNHKHRYMQQSANRLNHTQPHLPFQSFSEHKNQLFYANLLILVL